MEDKRVYSIREMKELGYADRTLRLLLKSDHFSEYGYRMKRKAYFILPKVERFIETQMDDHGEVIG